MAELKYKTTPEARSWRKRALEAEKLLDELTDHWLEHGADLEFEHKMTKAVDLLVSR